ncbi:Crp/Fnr family transcriptional regulator [Alkalithermobacter paradoxus]|uniref:cAMP receptor protein n=1 Tax=Alkalithermobacter paradoxus TaxID=29349 RepID=A0A1V4I508_9FIRM|nr:cAMP receptor protein [[Clostridium] thermoalcaliphilum]
MDKIYRILKHMEIFRTVKKETLQYIAQKGVVKNLKNDSIIYLDGENINKIYLVLDGKVIISKSSKFGEEKIIYIMEKEKFINEECIDNKSTSTSLKVMKEATLIVLCKEDVLFLMENDFNFNLLIINSMSSKLRRAYRQILNLGLKKINNRIASKIWKLGRDHGYEIEGNVHIDLDLSKSQIASMVGCTRESVSRFLTKIENEGIISQSNQKIRILDMKKLEKYNE